MATIKVFDAKGCKDLSCFDTLDSIPYVEEEEVVESEPDQASDDSVDF